jgi:Tfp pilus assembly protein PilF
MSQRRLHNDAVQFYRAKLENNPEMPKYNHNLATLMAAEGNLEEAKYLYKNALTAAPNNNFVRNDYALFLAKNESPDAGIHELRKTLLMKDEQPAIHLNLAVLYSQKGDSKMAMEHAQRARFLNPLNPMGLRNLARLQNASGDSKAALKNNMEAISIERKYNYSTINTDVYRSAAVQHVSRGNTEKALQLVRDARKIDNVHYESQTTIRTNAILANIIKRKGDQVAELEKEALEKANREAAKTQYKRGQVVNFHGNH